MDTNNLEISVVLFRPYSKTKSIAQPNTHVQAGRELLTIDQTVSGLHSDKGLYKVSTEVEALFVKYLITTPSFIL